MSTTTVQVRVDSDLKTRVDHLFTSLGLDTTTAVRMFFLASLEHDGIPFDVRHSCETPNADTIAAMNEYKAVKTHPERYKRYSSFRDALNEVLEDA